MPNKNFQTNDTMGTVYLLHYKQKIAHVHHYCGFTTDLKERMIRHKSGRGARLTRAMSERNIDFVLARTWEGPKKLEREIKKKKIKTQCPICAALAYNVQEGSPMILFPAYGRDYKSLQEVQEAFRSGKTFVAAGSGRYVTCGEVEQTEKVVQIWYFGKRRVVEIPVHQECSGAI